ncbi:uncharacterized protein LOC124375135, partial [Homalodisca vitripennis]|uniref:uncharacterized protein LOC124375135 n=1 Tax=Homalodisca vitripennis TaxID=197043 RepID=UPI001EEBF959
VPTVGGGWGGTLWGVLTAARGVIQTPPVPPSVSHSSALPLGRGCLTPCQLTRLVNSRLLHPAVRVRGSHLYRVRLLRARLHLPVGRSSHTHGDRTERTTVQWLMTPRHFWSSTSLWNGWKGTICECWMTCWK